MLYALINNVFVPWLLRVVMFNQNSHDTQVDRQGQATLIGSSYIFSQNKKIRVNYIILKPMQGFFQDFGQGG